MNGAPAKPISGVERSRAARIWRTASKTYPSGARSVRGRMRSTSAAVRTGLWMAGPSPLVNSRSRPIGSRISRMSAKRIAASTPRRSAAVTVTSVARPGSLHRSRNGTFERTAWYSGMYRPACRMNQTGVTSVGSRRQAFRNALSRSGSAGSGRESGLVKVVSHREGRRPLDFLSRPSYATRPRQPEVRPDAARPSRG